MRVLLIDDHEIVWTGTHRLLESLATEIDPGSAFAFTAVRSVGEALCLSRVGFDLVLLDYHLPDVSGNAALQAVREHFEGVPICLQSGETAPRVIRDLIDAGAAGFVPKSYRLEEMEAALHVVLRHRVYLPAEFVLAEDSTREQQPGAVDDNDLARFIADLSPRQREVLALAVQGRPIKLIARDLGIAEGTVKVHLSKVYKAMGVRNRTEALCRVFQAKVAALLGLR